MRKKRRINFYFEEVLWPSELAQCIALLFGRSIPPISWYRPTGAPYFEGDQTDPCGVRMRHDR